LRAAIPLRAATKTQLSWAITSICGTATWSRTEQVLLERSRPLCTVLPSFSVVLLGSLLGAWTPPGSIFTATARQAADPSVMMAVAGWLRRWSGLLAWLEPLDCREFSIR
jgi:hypothetical protein